MDDLISRQAAIDDILRRLDTLKMTEFGTGTFRDGVADGYARIISDLTRLPSAERRGRWEFNIDDEGWSWDYPYMCDQCGEWAEKEFKFCPNCGARMEVNHEEE